MKKFDTIKNKFNKIKKEIEEKKISNLGTQDLKKYEVSILELHSECEQIKGEARENLAGVSLEDLGAIFKESDDMWTEMSALLETIDTEFTDKQSQVDKLSAEIARQKAIIEMYEQKIASYTKMIKYDEKRLNDSELETELLKLINSEYESETKKIEKLQEQLDKHKEICQDINIDINILKYGGEARKKSNKKDKGEDVDWDSSFKDGNKFAKDDEDRAFADGLTKENWDRSFAGGTENLIGLGILGESEGEVEMGDPIPEDGDLAELVVPDLGDGPAKEAKEIIPVEVEGEVKLDDPIPAEEAQPEEEVKAEEAAPEETPEVELDDPIQPEAVPEAVPAEEVAAPVEETTPEVVLGDPIPAETAAAEPAVEEVAAPAEEPTPEVVLGDPIPAAEEPAAEVQLTAPIEDDKVEEIANAAAPTIGTNPNGAVKDIDWDKWENFFDETFSKDGEQVSQDNQGGPTLTL